jgi:hypothetical protein
MEPSRSVWILVVALACVGGSATAFLVTRPMAAARYSTRPQAKSTSEDSHVETVLFVECGALL